MAFTQTYGGTNPEASLKINVTSNKDKAALRRATQSYVRQLAKTKPWSIIALLFPGIGTTFTTYLPPLIIATMIRHFDGRIPTNLSETVPYLIAIASVWTFGEVLWRIAFLCLDFTDAKGTGNLHIEAMEILLEKDIGFFNDNFAGSLTKKSIAYGKNFESFVDTLAFNVFGSFLPLIFASIILWRISPWLVLTLLGAMALAIALVLPLIRRRQRLVHAREVASNTMAAHVADVIGNASAVRSFAHEDAELSQNEKLANDFTRAARKSWDYHVTRIDMVMAPLSILLNVVGLILAIKLTDNAVTLSTVFVTFSYFVNSSQVLFEFNRTYRNLENAITEAAQFSALELQKPIIADSPNAKKLQITDSVIEFDKVRFTHTENNQALFERLDFRLASGEKLGIIGRSGAGKSTIANLMLRFMDIDGGSIRIDGQDIRNITQKSLRQNIAYVPQESVLFHRTISQNIEYGRPGATHEEIKSAARLAHADEFISELPNGYETLVGERGVKLSGGQRQRIAIARAILKDAPILVLDEATSALDSESEKLIQDALAKLMQNRTTVVVAHRLSTIQNMDRIIVLDNGEIVEQGTHQELLKEKGTYAKLWKHQSGGFLES